MDEFSDTSKSLKPLARPQVVILPEQCEKQTRTADFGQRKKSVLKSVFLVLLSIFLLVAALCFGLWIIQTRIQYITQNIKDGNANELSSHHQTEGRSFDQKPWLSDKPANYMHVKDKDEDADIPLKSNDDDLKGKEQIKEISFDLIFDRPVVKIGTHTLLMKNTEKVKVTKTKTSKVLKNFDGKSSAGKDTRLERKTAQPYLLRRRRKDL